MSEAIPHVEQRCVFCGNAYREPRWGRAYTCGACGQPLREASQRVKRAFSLPSWVYYATGAVLLTGMLGWLVTTRQAEQRGVRQSQQGFGLLQQLPPHQEERIRRRLALLEEDRQKDPRDPVLLALQAESYLQLGVLHQKSDARKAKDELQRCQRLAAELAEVAPGLPHVAAFLIQQAQAPSELGWTVNGSSSFITRQPLIQDDAATGLMGEIPSRIGMPDVPSKTEFHVDRERRDARTDTDVMVPGSSFPTIGRPPTNGPGAFGAFPGPRGDGPRGFFGNGPSFGAAPPPPAGLSLEELRAQAAANPTDPHAAEALGERLEAQGQYALITFAGREPGRTMFTRNLAEALQVYSASAEHLRTRLRRAQMLFAAAGIQRKLGNSDEEIRLLHQAATEAPYAPLIWRQLQNALLNKGDFGQSREAWKQYQDWLLPRTRDRRL